MGALWRSSLTFDHLLLLVVGDMSELRERAVTVFQVLGPLGIQVAGRPLVVRAPRQRSVLAMLLLSAGRAVSQDQLIEAVWPDGPPATGRTQVAICVTALRKMFREAGCCDGVIVTSARGYRIPVDANRIDVVEFTERVADARAAVRNDQTSIAITRFTEALALWHGPALPGLRGRPLEQAVERLEQERLVVQEELAALKLAIGQHDAVVGELAVLVDEHPTRQTARAQLMLAQYRSGARAEALATFAEGRRLAEGDGDGEVAPVLRDLYEAILNDSPSLSARATTGTAAGSRSERVPAQLPADVPSFTGRCRELSVLDNLVADGTPDGSPPVGLVTGAAGVGKTGLAIHWARKVAEQFPHGQLFVDLHRNDNGGPVDTGTVLDGFLRALGVPTERIPASLPERAALYRSVLNRRRVLVVLDNARSFAQIAPLVPGGGTCCVLVTSRAQLGDLIDRHGATRLRLGPLDTAESVELLGRMVPDARVAGDPDGTARLAELCEGLPLALRVAAARLVAKPHWTIDHLVARLADPARRLDELSAGGHDVRARILASYRELPARAAMLFRQLSLADRTSVGVTAAATLAGTTSAEAESLLESLVDAHLAEVAGRDGSEVRYRLAMLPRLFARERAEAEILDRVAATPR